MFPIFSNFSLTTTFFLSPFRGKLLKPYHCHLLHLYILLGRQLLPTKSALSGARRDREVHPPGSSAAGASSRSRTSGKESTLQGGACTLQSKVGTWGSSRGCLGFGTQAAFYLTISDFSSDPNRKNSYLGMIFQSLSKIPQVLLTQVAGVKSLPLI